MHCCNLNFKNELLDNRVLPFVQNFSHKKILLLLPLIKFTASFQNNNCPVYLAKTVAKWHDEHWGLLSFKFTCKVSRYEPNQKSVRPSWTTSQCLNQPLHNLTELCNFLGAWMDKYWWYFHSLRCIVYVKSLLLFKLEVVTPYYLHYGYTWLIFVRWPH